MPASPLPPGFEKSRPATRDELRALPEPGHVAIHTVERCIASHHVVEVDYTDAAGLRSAIRIRPAFIRHNVAQHLVLWVFRPTRNTGKS